MAARRPCRPAPSGPAGPASPAPPSAPPPAGGFSAAPRLASGLRRSSSSPQLLHPPPWEQGRRSRGVPGMQRGGEPRDPKALEGLAPGVCLPSASAPAEPSREEGHLPDGSPTAPGLLALLTSPDCRALSKLCSLLTRPRRPGQVPSAGHPPARAAVSAALSRPCSEAPSPEAPFPKCPWDSAPPSPVLRGRSSLPPTPLALGRCSQISPAKATAVRAALLPTAPPRPP